MTHAVTPRGLLGAALLACLAAALFGAVPLANWADATAIAPIGRAADGWGTLTGRTGLDRPYTALRCAAQKAEAMTFGPAD